MARVIDTIEVCEDCVQAIANDDYSALDYRYSEKESEKREQAIREGIENLGGWGVIGDELGFRRSACDCCGMQYSGNRHECTILGDD